MTTTASQPINPTPKSRFQSSPDNVAKHRKLLELPELQRALDYALMSYSNRVSLEIKDGNSAMVAGAKQLAVHEFITEFKSLAETPPPASARKDLDNLGGN
jgi:hypothetical protein